MSESRLLTRVCLENYKSIASCDVALRNLTFFVGPNGAGKSNFLDALKFVADALRISLEFAMRDRGGIQEVRRRSGGHPTHFGIRLEVALEDGTVGRYAFRVAARKGGGYVVADEECVLVGPEALATRRFFRVGGGRSSSSAPVAPAAAEDRLYLVAASGLPEFRPIFDALSRMGFYNLNPRLMRELQSPDAGDLLAQDGHNLASVLARLEKQAPHQKRRIEEYLAQVVPGVESAQRRQIGPKETVEFRQKMASSSEPWRFLAANMSDGTLRALGILVALFQTTNGGVPRVPLVGLEEPEAALHPGATAVLLEGLREASARAQVLVTSHSPDLLDDKQLDPDMIRPVLSEGGSTAIGTLDETSRRALHERLYTAGELMRLDQLRPTVGPHYGGDGHQLELFGDRAS